MQAPEKIYIDSKAIGDNISTTVHTERQDYPTCTEYIRTDAFIKKAENFFENYLEEEGCKFGVSEWVEVRSDFDSLDSLIRAFVNYIKGE